MKIFYMESFVMHFEVMKPLSLLFIVLLTTWLQQSASCQQVGLYAEYGGLFFNSDRYNYFSVSRVHGYTYRAGLLFEKDYRQKKLKSKATLGVNYNSARFKASSQGGLGGGSVIDVQVRSWALSSALYPVSLKFQSKLEVEAGVDLAFLLKEHFEGTEDWWYTDHVITPEGTQYFISSGTRDIRQRYDKLSGSWSWGLRANILYNFTIRPAWTVSPRFSIYLGLSHDYKNFLDNLRTSFFSIGFVVTRSTGLHNNRVPNK